MASNPYVRPVIQPERRIYYRAVGNRKLYHGCTTGRATPMVHPGQEGVMDRESPAHMALLARWVAEGKAVAFTDISDAQSKGSAPWTLHLRDLAKAAEPPENFSYVPMADLEATTGRGAVVHYPAGSISRLPADPGIRATFQRWVAEEKMLAYHPRLDGPLREGWLVELREEAAAARLAVEEAAAIAAEQAEQERLLQEAEAAEAAAKEAAAEEARNAAARHATAEAAARAATRSNAR